jgi:predicted acetylornithine/succinylornithine family transaminase
MKPENFLEQSSRYICNTYGRIPMMLVSGNGSKVRDSEGREYLDFISGLAACPLGHGDPGLARALYEQAFKLIHVSNIFHIDPQIKLARILVENSAFDNAFFCNSGAEANEGAIKLARKYFHDRNEHERFHIITMENSFHGRTLATLAATGQTKYRMGFEPHTAGFRHAPFGDIEALRTQIDAHTAAVLLEPIQGEGGVRMAGAEYFQQVRRLCDETGTLMILDEVQTGMGRTGRLFAHEHFGISPDIMTLAKGIAGGVPMGAVLAKDFVAASFVPGTHASTFGGNPLCCAAAVYTLSRILDEGFLDSVRRKGEYLSARLAEVAAGRDAVTETRGLGLMAALELAVPGADVATTMREAGVLINCTAERVLRFLPPLIITEEEIDVMTGALDKVLTEKIGARA